MAVSDKKRATNDKYNAKCDSILLRPLKEEGERIRAAAKESGKSLQRFILDAVDDTIACNNNNMISCDTIDDNGSTISCDITQDTAPRSLSDLPQPPDNIPKDNRTALVVWMLSHGWTGDDVTKYFDDNSVTAETVTQLSGVPWDILKDSATLEPLPALPLPPDDIAAAPVEVLAQWLHDHGYTARQIREYLKDGRK